MSAAEPWPIDRYTGTGPRQRVLIEAEVFTGPDPEDDAPETRFYTFAIANGDPHVDGRELLSIREDHVRSTVRRMPEPVEPTMVPAHALKGFEIQVFGEWRRVAGIAGDDSPFAALYVEGLDGAITILSSALVPARLPEDQR